MFLTALRIRIREALARIFLANRSAQVEFVEIQISAIHLNGEKLVHIKDGIYQQSARGWCVGLDSQ